MRIAPLIAAIFYAQTALALSVPLTVQETLTSGGTGLSRTAAPVTVGLPLPETSGITSVSQLGMSGTAAAQFRPLAWWPNGNVRWVLADFQTDIITGQVKSGVSLTNGSGSFGGGNLATDGSTITVNTGAAQFVIRKASSNVFDSVTVGASTLVTTGNAGRLSVVGIDDTVYTSANDSASTAVIEENGPVRAVVKTTGSLKSAGGTRILDYTLRLHFYAGKSYVKGEVTLRNASQSAPNAILFKSAELVVPLTLGASKTVSFSRKSDTVSRALSGTAYLFQGYNASRDIPYGTNCYSWDPPAPGTCSGSTYTFDSNFLGLGITAGAETVNAMGNNQEWSQGYAGVTDGTKTVNTGMRWMSANYPAGLEFKDTGESSIELYSKRNTKALKLQFGKHDMREVFWDFNLTGRDGKEALYAVQHPLLAKADFAYYRDSKAFFGQSELVTEAEQQSVFAAVGKTSPSLANPAYGSYYRNWWWSETGGNNQMDFPLDDIFDFYRTGNAGFYLNGEQRTQFNLVTGTSFSDDFTLQYVAQASDPLSTSAGISGDFVDTEHANLASTPFYYFVSGSEAAKESFLEYGERLYADHVRGFHPLPSTPYFRAWSRKLRNIALVYEFSVQTGAPVTAYKTLLDGAVSTFLDLRDSPLQGTNNYTTPHGRNMDRGYVWWDTTLGSGVRVVHSFFHTQVHFEAMWQLRRIMQETNWNYSRSQDLDDYLTGLAHFIFDDLLLPTVTNESHGWKYGFQYDSTLDTANSQTGILPASAERAAVWLYQQTGDATYLDKAAQLLWEIASYATNRLPSELQEQAFMWAYLNRPAVWQTLPVTVTDNGGGSYTLNWAVPQGVTKYQIKYSGKPIVEWLGFNQVTRAFQYDPAQYAPFFAASNINNPAPSAQTVTLTGLPSAQTFSAKYYTGTVAATPPTTHRSLIGRFVGKIQ